MLCLGLINPLPIVTRVWSTDIESYACTVSKIGIIVRLHALPRLSIILSIVLPSPINRGSCTTYSMSVDQTLLPRSDW